MLNNPSVLHCKQRTGGNDVPFRHPNSNPLCCLHLPYSSASRPEGQELVLGQAEQQLLLLQEN